LNQKKVQKDRNLEGCEGRGGDIKRGEEKYDRDGRGITKHAPQFTNNWRTGAREGILITLYSGVIYRNKKSSLGKKGGNGLKRREVEWFCSGVGFLGKGRR